MNEQPRFCRLCHFCCATRYLSKTFLRCIHGSPDEHHSVERDYVCEHFEPFRDREEDEA